MNKRLIGLYLLSPLILIANPKGASIVLGQAELMENGNHLMITPSENAIIEWDNFSIELGETTQFVQPHAESSVLNRVISLDPSRLFGSLQSNGQVLLINQNGIVVGREASIDTAGWIASTLDFQNRSFQDTKDWLFSGDSESSIDIQGAIRSPRISLFAKEVNCDGTLTGQRIDCFAGLQCLMNGNRIHTFPSTGNLSFSGAAAAETISLFGDSIIFSGTLSGVSIYVGGSREGKDPLIASARFVHVGPEARALTARDGEAIFFSKGSLIFEGDVFSPNGFVETSGLEHLAFKGHVDTDKTGTLLLDPNDIRIVAAPGMSNPVLTPIYDGSPSINATILNTDLQTLLGSTSVVIQTNNVINGGTGDIVQDLGAPVTWASGTNLTLSAYKSILINDSISATGPGSQITLIAGLGDIVLTSTMGTPALVEASGLHTAGTTTISASATNGSITMLSAFNTKAVFFASNETSAGDIRATAGEFNFISANAAATISVTGILVARGDAYVTTTGAMNFIAGDSTNLGVEASAYVVVGNNQMAMPIGGNLYFSAGSLNFDTTRAMTGGRSSAALSAYGLNLGTGNITGAVSGDVLWLSGYPIATGSGISSLFEGEINVAIGGNATFIATPGPSMAFAGAGIASLFSGGAGSSRAISVAIGGNIVGTTGGGSGAGVGFNAYGDLRVAVRGSALFQTTTGTPASSTEVVLSSDFGSVEFASYSADFLGAGTTFSRVRAAGDVTIETIQGLNLDLAAVISTGGNVTLRSTGNSIFIQNDSILEAPGQVLAIAGRNIEMRDSSAESFNDRIIFVVDDLFGTRPLVGPGAFITNPSIFAAPLGVSIYTARQGQNSINFTTFNGSSFTARTLFVNTAEEVWCIYYPEGITTFPFTIFYKECENLVTYQATLSVSELLRNLHPYDEALGWFERFTISSEEMLEPHMIRRRKLMGNLPKSWTTIVNHP